MKPLSVCLPKSDIPLLLSGDMPPDEAAAAEKHIAECESCRSTIESMIADSRWWDDARKSLVATATRFPLHLEITHDTEPTPTAKILELLGPTDDPNMLGRIGPYEIIGLLGQGGMGAVFKGFDRSLNRFVAIKMLLPHLAASGAARKRFAREGQAVATGSVELKSKPSLMLTMQFDDKVDSNGKSESHIEGAIEFKSNDEFWLAVPDTSVRPSQEAMLAGQPRVVWKMRRVVATSPPEKDEAQEVIVLEPNGSSQGHWTTKRGYWIACHYPTAIDRTDKEDPGCLAVRLGIVHGGPLHPGPYAVNAEDLQIISQMWLVILEGDTVISRARLDLELDHGNEEHYIATINATAGLVPKMEIEFEERNKFGTQRYRIPIRTFIKKP